MQGNRYGIGKEGCMVMRAPGRARMQHQYLRKAGGISRIRGHRQRRAEAVRRRFALGRNFERSVCFS